MSQNSLILEYMKHYGSITPWEAIEHCGCLRLSARIADLKAKGYNIGSVNVKHGKRHYSRYFLRGEAKQ